MSRCAWRTTTGASSRPDEAGTRTTTFPSASVAASRPRAAAQARTCCTRRLLLLSTGGRCGSARRSAPRRAPARARRAVDAHRRSVSDCADHEEARSRARRGQRERRPARRRTSRSRSMTAASANCAAIRNAVVATTPMRGPATVIARMMKTLMTPPRSCHFGTSDRLADSGERAPREQQHGRARAATPTTRRRGHRFDGSRPARRAVPARRSGPLRRARREGEQRRRTAVELTARTLYAPARPRRRSGT